MRDVTPHVFGSGLPSSTASFGSVLEASSFWSGQSLTVEGTVVALRSHTVVDKNKTHHRFLAIVLDVTRGNNRTFENGVEVETKPSNVKVVGRKGFKTWEETTVTDPNELTLEQIAVRLGGKGQHEGLCAGDGSGLHPHVPNRHEFLADKSLMLSVKLELGQNVRLKLRGSSHFVEVVWLTESSTLTKGTAYAGEEVKQNWGDKIASQKTKPVEVAKPDPLKDAVADDEW